MIITAIEGKSQRTLIKRIEYDFDLSRLSLITRLISLFGSSEKSYPCGERRGHIRRTECLIEEKALFNHKTVDPCPFAKILRILYVAHLPILGHIF